jgi:AAA domain/Domain of unknown function (DUF6371)/CHC2 zinc finger
MSFVTESPLDLGGAAWLASKLEGSRRSGDGYVACCPSHDDKTPSLSINEDEKGKVLVYCHAGCDQDEVIDALRELCLWPVKNQPRRNPTNPHDVWSPMFSAPRSMGRPNFTEDCGCRPAEIYEYLNLDGQLLGYVCRLENDDGKSFRPLTPWRSPKGDLKWRVAGFQNPKPLFRLYSLARSPSAPVLIVEGEKTAVEAADLLPDYVVLTWPGGANGVGKIDWSPLQGRDVTIWPDADESGRRAADEIATILELMDVAAKIVELPDSLPKGWDLADQKPEGLNIENLLRTAKEVRRSDLASYLISAAQLSEMDVPVREMVIDPFIPTSSINLLFAQRGVGKTWVGMTLAKAVVQGEDFLGFEVPEARGILYIDGEMPLASLKQRVAAIGAGKNFIFFRPKSSSVMVAR